MSKVGLKDTLTLLAKGYSKKEIDALASIDEESNQEEQPVVPDEDKAPVPDPGQAQEKVQEPDYKAMYEDLLEKNNKTEATLKKIQQDNVHKDSAPASEEIKREQAESLTNLVRGFM